MELDCIGLIRDQGTTMRLGAAAGMVRRIIRLVV